MATQEVHRRQIFTGDIIDGTGQTALTIKVGGVSPGRVIITVIRDVNIAVADKLTARTTDDNDTVIAHRGAGILFAKVGVDDRIFYGYADLIAQILITTQELLQSGIFLPT